MRSLIKTNRTHLLQPSAHCSAHLWSIHTDTHSRHCTHMPVTSRSVNEEANIVGSRALSFQLQWHAYNENICKSTVFFSALKWVCTVVRGRKVRHLAPRWGVLFPRQKFEKAAVIIHKLSRKLSLDIGYFWRGSLIRRR